MKRTHPIRSATALVRTHPDRRFKLANRIVMAPLTRNRASAGLVPGPFAAEYYAQRASGRLIVAEATQISAQAQGYADTPGCYTDEQVRGWKKVTDAVHAKGGVIAVQLCIPAVSLTQAFKRRQAPVGPSAISGQHKDIRGRPGLRRRIDASCRSDWTKSPVSSKTSAMRRPRHRGRVRRRRTSWRPWLSARRLSARRNQQRTDAYGGCIENRSRLALEVAKSCADAIAPTAGRADITVSTAGDSRDSDPQALFNHVVENLNPLGLAYLHVVEARRAARGDGIPFDYAALRSRFDGALMVNNGYDRQMAVDAVASGRADLVSFGRLFIANPDLVERLRENAPLNRLMGQETFYGGGPTAIPTTLLSIKAEPPCASKKRPRLNPTAPAQENRGFRPGDSSDNVSRYRRQLSSRTYAPAANRFDL